MYVLRAVPPPRPLCFFSVAPPRPPCFLFLPALGIFRELYSYWKGKHKHQKKKKETFDQSWNRRYSYWKNKQKQKNIVKTRIYWLNLCIWGPCRPPGPPAFILLLIFIFIFYYHVINCWVCRSHSGLQRKGSPGKSASNLFSSPELRREGKKVSPYFI